MFSFRRVSIASTIATFLLVAIGGLVRATKSGWGCGEHWPGCRGRLIPALATRAEVIEFTHRAAALSVIVLLSFLAIRALVEHRDRPVLVKASLGAAGLVVAQALIGAVVIKLHLEAESVVVHLLVALALLGVLIFITMASLMIDKRIRTTPDQGLNRTARLAAGMVLVTLLVGSYVSGSGAGSAFGDWPLMDGRLVPDLAVEANAIHFFHRALAALTGLVLGYAAHKIIRRKDEMPLAASFARAAIVLFAVEVVVGAANVWTDLNSAVVSIHLATGALVWTCSVGMALATQPGFERVAEPGRTARRHPALEAH